MTEKLPPLSVVAVPIDDPLLIRLIVLFASAVPERVGVVSLVILSVLETPVSERSVRLGVEGAAGAMESNSEAVGVELNP